MMNLVKTAFLLGLLTMLIVAVGGYFGGRGGAAMALVLAAGMNFFSYWFSDKIVLAASRAKPVAREAAPRLYAIVERLCGRTGMPLPRLYVLPEEAPNAFATGRNPHHAAVAVTQGILTLLDDEELEGVLAHELSHVKNRDILISSVAATLAGAVMFLASMARWAALFGGVGDRRDGERGGGVLGLLVGALLAPIAAMLIQMAVSRSREYQADATGAEMVGHPQGLARALEKLDRYSKRVPMLAAGGPTTSHLFIVKPFAGASLMNLFSTHPPIPERIRRLLGR
ncbi:MAG: zinc metalloprotease HtpX [Acidobacteria bacterium]|nr:zinc metalloprotease HtpX [Acidobacteriota bacterium]